MEIQDTHKNYLRFAEIKIVRHFTALRFTFLVAHPQIVRLESNINTTEYEPQRNL